MPRRSVNKEWIFGNAAWIQVSDGSVPVKAMFKIANGFKIAGVVEAKSTCWSMLKGGFSVEASASAELYFEVLNYLTLPITIS